MRSRVLAVLVFIGSLVWVGDVRTDPMPKPAQVSRASVDAGTPLRLVYNAASTGVLADLAAITANRVCVADANGLPTASSVTSTTLAFLDATSSVQTQIDTKLANTGTANRVVVTDGSGNRGDLAALTASRALESNASGLPTASAVTSTTLAFLDATSSVQTQLDAKFSAVTDTTTVDLTAAAGSLSADVLRAALFPKTVGKNPAGNQAITASTETDVTGLTALNLPVLTTVNTRTYRVGGVIKVANGGASAGRFDARFYNGANGTKADTMIDQTFTYIGAGSSASIPVGPFEFTPGNSAHTKFGVAVLFPQNGNVLGATTTQSHILVEEVP